MNHAEDCGCDGCQAAEAVVEREPEQILREREPFSRGRRTPTTALCDRIHFSVK